MKTTIKLAAIAAVTVLLALSCSADISLTGRDLSERNESKNAEYTNTLRGSDVKVYFYSELLFNATAIADSRKEIDITFPAEARTDTSESAIADILNESNANIDAKLKEFLTLYKYTNPATDPSTLTPPVLYTPSTLSDSVPYTFVRRNNNVITIRLDSVPDINRIVAKIDASKFRVNGHLTDLDEDGIAGESYDDQYEVLSISNGSSMTPTSWTDDFFRPETAITLTFVNNLPSSGGNFDATNKVKNVYFMNSGFSGENNKYMRDIFNDIKGNFELQKYNKDAKNWEKAADAALYVYTSIIPDDFPDEYPWNYSDLLYFKIDAEDLGIYRIKATNLKNLKTSSNYFASPKPAKIKIDDDLTFYNTPYTDPVSTYDYRVRRWQDDNPVDYSNIIIKTDSNNRNVVIEMLLNPVGDDLNSGTLVYPETMNTDAFNKCFKLVYINTNDENIINENVNLATLTNLVELKITDVKYSASKRLNANNDRINCITITLDPSYQIHGDRQISLLLSPDFKYGGGHVTFGNYLNGDTAYNNPAGTYYNGSYFWRSYGLTLEDL